jgi:predicted DNA-binding transcriptional regulator AlpA
MESTMLTAKQVATMLGKHRHTIRKWAAKGYIPKPSYVFGKSKFWSLQDIESFLAKRVQPCTSVDSRQSSTE